MCLYKILEKGQCYYYAVITVEKYFCLEKHNNYGRTYQEIDDLGYFYTVKFLLYMILFR